MFRLFRVFKDNKKLTSQLEGKQRVIDFYREKYEEAVARANILSCHVDYLEEELFELEAQVSGLQSQVFRYKSLLKPAKKKKVSNEVKLPEMVKT